MEVLIENILIYGFAILLIVGVVSAYVIKEIRQTKAVNKKLDLAKEEGLHEPVSLYPVIDPNRCIGSGACVRSCPEHDILGLNNGRAVIINASACIGHGACFRACPVEAISLFIGTEKRGVHLPELLPTFETNVKGIYIAGELGGMGLIRNAVTQGKEAVENIAKQITKNHQAEYDLIVVGAGPAGISATLAAKKAGLKVLTLEQDTLGGTVYTYPREKIIMTHPMDLPLYGKVKLKETSKDELLGLWVEVLTKNDIEIVEKTKVESIIAKSNTFELHTSNADVFTTATILLALGRRGTPRKLNIAGEMSQKVAYRLLDAELIKNKKILIVGGGDSAIEAALMLANDNQVILTYRSSQFNRLKVRNNTLISSAIQTEMIAMKYNTELLEIKDKTVKLLDNTTDTITEIENDLVYIFAGGELPTEFLKKAGIQMKTLYGEAVLKH